MKEAIYRVDEVVRAEGEVLKSDPVDRIDFLLNKIRPEIESLHRALLVIVGFDPCVDTSRLKEVAVNKLREGGFKSIKEKHLDKPGLFSFNERQERRDILGKIIREIIVEQYPRFNNYQELFKRYTALNKKDRNSNTQIVEN